MSIDKRTTAATQGRQPYQQRGVSMIEVLIALLLLTGTLLGATALQITGLHTNRSAYYRTQASILAYDIADRIRLNKSYAVANSGSYNIDTSDGSTPSGSTCIDTLNGCSAASLRAEDIREWSDNFFDVTSVGQDNDDWKAVLPSGVGVVTASGTSFSVTVSWNEVDWNVGTSSNKSAETKSFSIDFTVSD